jgi:translation initiation factor 6
MGVPAKLEQQIRETLGVDVVKTSIAMTSLIGIFSALNNKTMIVPDILEKSEKKTLSDSVGELVVLDVKYTAIGNLVAMNDPLSTSPALRFRLAKMASALEIR